MATEAQVSANRSNAQKSTGPRTPEGKAAVARNAVKHGLLAQEVVIKGEDPGEFELYRDGMLEELAPAGPMESLLAERIVGLAWRLRRAERLQAAAFDTLEEKKEKPKPVWSAEEMKWVFPQTAKLGPEDESLAVGRRVVQDFAQTRILDRLLMYERRIEHSLYRTMAELRNLRRLREAGSGGAGSCLGEERREEGEKVRRSEAQRVRPSSVPTFSPSSVVPPVPDGVSTNGADGQEQLCETNPIPGGPGENQAPCSGRMEEVGRGRPTPDQVEGRLHEEGPQTRSVAFGSPETPDGVTTNGIDAQGQSCETNPICAGANKGQVGYEPIFRRRR